MKEDMSLYGNVGYTVPRPYFVTRLAHNFKGNELRQYSL